MKVHGMWDESHGPSTLLIMEGLGVGCTGLREGEMRQAKHEGVTGWFSITGREDGGDRAAPRHQDGSQDSPHCHTLLPAAPLPISIT